MALDLTYDELLRYTNDEREKWRAWLVAHPGCLEVAVQPHGQLLTVGKVIDHIFLIERRHLQWLTDDSLSESTGLTGNNTAPLFDYGASVRRELEQLAQTLDEGQMDEAREFVAGGRPVSMTPRKLLFNVLLHEIRHWAQVALALRAAGFEPPGDHDLFYSRALR